MTKEQGNDVNEVEDGPSPLRSMVDAGDTAKVGPCNTLSIVPIARGRWG